MHHDHDHPDVEPGPAVEDVWVQLQVRSWLQPRPRALLTYTNTGKERKGF